MDAPPPDLIRVSPSALGDGAALARGVAAGVLRCREALPTGSGAAAVGDPGCAEALGRVALLLEQATSDSAASIEQLAAALDTARGTYQLADGAAVPGRPVP